MTQATDDAFDVIENRINSLIVKVESGEPITHDYMQRFQTIVALDTLQFAQASVKEAIEEDSQNV